MSKINSRYYWSVVMVLCHITLNSQSNINLSVIDQVIATVGQEILLKSELESSKIQYISNGFPIQNETECILLEELLYQKLLLNQARLDSIEISEPQILSEIDRRLRYFIDQLGSEKALENYYGKSINQIKDEYYEDVKNQLMSQNMQSSITAQVKVTPSDVKKFFLTANKDSLPKINTLVKIAQIVIKPEVTLTEKETIKIKLSDIRKRVIEGEDFGTLAVLYSEDPGSSVKRGELGFMTRDMLVPEFASAGFKLNKGEVSDIIETEFGFHIIQLIEKRGQESNFKHILMKPKISLNDLSKAKIKLDSIKNQIQSNTLKFEDGAEQFSTDKATKFNGGVIKHPNSGTPYFDVQELGQFDANLFFVIEKMEKYDVSAPILFQEPDGSNAYRIIQLLDRKDPHEINIKDDYSQLQEMALIEKQKKIISDWINTKIKTTYININDQFKSCDFDSTWTINPND